MPKDMQLARRLRGERMESAARARVRGSAPLGVERGARRAGPMALGVRMHHKSR
eukprot:CAMPEP_0176287736 /NCGR_PEP_ID=MMETSP0121_2-20121125/53596_1 /TAXON_ID=160619 /ORGANISM="Kryptoperidinium foliaceum, Strain CCMP 1326" /LENGTH=53 /DNA_ID=CAMNT_0017628375 /DNA_START=13 /DNA_END=172 /DNA_ORIENTATION=-